MNRLIILLMLSIGISACSDHDHGPDAEEKVAAPKVEDDSHEHSINGHEHSVNGHEHSDDEHDHGDDHEHAPETEAFYGEEAEDAQAPTENEADHQPHDHHKSHEEGEHDHHH